MECYQVKFNVFKKRIVIASIILFLIIVMTAIIILVFPGTTYALLSSQQNRELILLNNSHLSLSPTLPASTPSPNSPTPSVDERTQQLITEAQNDISAANTVIFWTGFIFAVIVGLVTVGVGIAGFFGIREYRDLFRNFQQIRTDLALQFQQVSDQLQQIVVLKNQIEDQSNQLDTITNVV